jgi:prepilin peptidase CpaA
VLLLHTILWLLVGLATVWDLSQRRLPNKLIVIGLLIGFVLQTQIGGIAGLGLSFLGALCGLALLIVPFALRVMGGGDVKLTMVCGSFLGWLGVVEITLLASVFHGALALCIVLTNRWLLAMGRNTLPSDKLPYALAVAIATILYTTEAVRLF